MHYLSRTALVPHVLNGQSCFCFWLGGLFMESNREIVTAKFVRKPAFYFPWKESKEQKRRTVLNRENPIINMIS